MKIKKIHINNILSYGNEIIDFNDDLNIIVGSNGSGKSNLINIIIYVLKRYCFKNYEISSIWGEERIGNNKRYSIVQKNPLYNSSEDFFFQKHKNKSREKSFIDLSVKFEEQDILNLQYIKNKKEKICEFLDKKIDNVHMMSYRYEVSKDSIKEIFDINSSDLRIGEELIFKIRENETGWEIQNSIEKYYIYMNYFSLILEILDLMNEKHEIKNTFVFFEAYRNNSAETTRVGINEFNNSNNISNLQSWQNLSSLAYSIGINSTYIMLATQKFGRIMRNFVELEDGINKFNNLPEYLKLKMYFKKFEYDINLKCISPANNIYQFYIKKDNLEIEIDTISSGEREIINFIFGMFLEKLNDSLIIIDEPELHLHPNWQKKLIQILKEETRNSNIQLMFVTHSASFITYNTLDNIFRIYKENGYSKCLKMFDLLNKDKKETLRKNLSVINATNNEKIFFSNFVILVEGITDEILFKKIYEKEIGKIDDGLEFVGINGKKNFNNFVSVLDALKIKYFYICDYDNLEDYDELKELLDVDKKAQNSDLKKQKNQSYNCLNLLNAIDIILKENSKENYEKLRLNYKLYNERFSGIKKNLTNKEENFIMSFIERKYDNEIYILKNGEIENYLGIGNNNKSLGFEKVISIINDDEEYEKFTQTKGYTELKKIIMDISFKIKNRK